MPGCEQLVQVHQRTSQELGFSRQKATGARPRKSMRIECVGTARPSPCIDVNGGLLAKHGAAWHGAVAVTMDAVVESRMTGRQGAGTHGGAGRGSGLERGG